MLRNLDYIRGSTGKTEVHAMGVQIFVELKN
jgi:hypothetical protein